MNNLYEEKKLIRAYDVDLNNNIKLNSLFNLFQDAASVHAENMGLGFDSLKKYDLAWVLSWAKVKINKFPAFGQEVKIVTWPKSRHKLYSIRDFHVADKNGNIVSGATTAWLLINVKTKRISDLRNLPVEISYLPDRSGLDDLPEKIQLPAGKKHIYTKKIRYSDIDINLHTNNTVYVESALNCWEPDKFSTKKIETFEINFSAESFFDDEIMLFASPDEQNGNTDLVEGINGRNNRSVFQAKIKWSE